MKKKKRNKIDVAMTKAIILVGILLIMAAGFIGCGRNGGLSDCIEHDYQPLVFADEGHWIKCSKCNKVVESSFYFKVVCSVLPPCVT